MTVTDYLAIKDSFVNSPAIIKDGAVIRLYQGKWIPEKEFKKHHVLPTILNGCRANPDKRKSFLI